jgi:hypothetical protein
LAWSRRPSPWDTEEDGRPGRPLPRSRNVRFDDSMIRPVIMRESTRGIR